MFHHGRVERDSGRPRAPAHERLERLIEARRAFFAGDVEQALGAYTKLLNPATPHPSALLDVQKILLAFDQMAALDSEFRVARGRLRRRLVELLNGSG